jgi:hypothetical protein
VLTSWKYAPRVKMAVALLDDFFDHPRQLLIPEFSRANTGYFREIFNRSCLAGKEGPPVTWRALCRLDQE